MMKLESTCDDELSELSAIDYEELQNIQKDFEVKQAEQKATCDQKHHKKVVSVKELSQKHNWKVNSTTSIEEFKNIIQNIY